MTAKASGTAPATRIIGSSSVSDAARQCRMTKLRATRPFGPTKQNHGTGSTKPSTAAAWRHSAGRRSAAGAFAAKAGSKRDLKAIVAPGSPTQIMAWRAASSVQIGGLAKP